MLSNGGINVDMRMELFLLLTTLTFHYTRSVPTNMMTAVVPLAHQDKVGPTALASGDGWGKGCFVRFTVHSREFAWGDGWGDGCFVGSTVELASGDG